MSPAARLSALRSRHQCCVIWQNDDGYVAVRRAAEDTEVWLHIQNV